MDYRIWRQSDIFLKRAAGSPALRILVGLGRKVEFGRGVAGEGAGRTHAVCATLRQGRGGGATIRASARPAHAARPGVHGHHQPVLRGCRNHQEAEKDAADRASIVAALERQLVKGDKALVGNKGFRRYLKTISEEHFAIDPDKIEEEKKFDGIFVLRTNTDLNPLEAMLCYKQLWTIEQTFRTAKHLFSTRPIFHKLDETIRGHVFCSFLALVLKAELEERIAALGRVDSWPEVIADLDSLAETEIDYDGKRFIVRSGPRPAASLALRAAGVALPPTVRDAAAS